MDTLTESIETRVIETIKHYGIDQARAEIILARTLEELKLKGIVIDTSRTMASLSDDARAMLFLTAGMKTVQVVYPQES